MSASRSRLCTLVMTGRRPTNSGIMPNLSRSSGITSANASAAGWSLRTRSFAPKPIPLLPTLCSMIFSRPENDPPQMNSTFVVSIWMNS